MPTPAPSGARRDDDPASGAPTPPRLVEVAREAAAPMPPSAFPGEHPFLNGPVAGILMGNALTFTGAVVQHWPVLPVLWVYWGQSVAIGLANVIRLHGLRGFSTDGFTFNGRPVQATRAGIRSVTRFFAFHYGAFHLAFALVLLRHGFGHLDARSAVMVAANVAVFAISHIWHLFTPGGQAFRRKPNLGTLMIYPYLRIVPMHAAIIFASAFPPGALPFFVVLKTGADLGMHEVERRLFLSAAE